MAICTLNFLPTDRVSLFAEVAVPAQVRRIYIVPIVGGEPKRLTFDGMHIECLAWTADGREIVFASDRGGLLSLWRIAASGGTVEPFSVGEMGTSAPSISSQGNRLAFVKKIDDTNIYRLSLDRTRRNEPTRIASSTQRDGNPGISPDGKGIAFESERSGQHEIWLSDSDGSNVSRLTDLGTIPAVQAGLRTVNKSLSTPARKEALPPIFM